MKAPDTAEVPNTGLSHVSTGLRWLQGEVGESAGAELGVAPAKAGPPPGSFVTPAAGAASGQGQTSTEELVDELTSKWLQKSSTAQAPPKPPDSPDANSTVQQLLRQVLENDPLRRNAPKVDPNDVQNPWQGLDEDDGCAGSLESMLSSAASPAPAPSSASSSRPPAPPMPELPSGVGDSRLGPFAPSDRPRPPPPPIPDQPAEVVDAAAAVDADGEEVPKPSRGNHESKPRFSFEAYLEEDVWKQGLQSGKYIKGTLRASTTKLKTAHVIPVGCKPKERDLAVIGKKCRNRAVHGDVVICELLPEREATQRMIEEEDDLEEYEKLFRPPPGLSLPQDSDSSDEEVLFSGPLVAKEEPSKPSTGAASSRPKLAKVVAIAERKGSDRVIVCTLHPNDIGTKKGRVSEDVKDDDRFLKAKPTDKRMPWILLQINDVTRKVLSIPGRLDRFKLWPIQMVAWGERASLPLGRLKGECLGKAGDLEAEEKHALIENGLDFHDVDFEDDLLDQVDEIVSEARKNFLEEVTHREDLRRKRIFTIDPATARDLDDAIHVDEFDNEVEVGVHIADVGHFVKLGSMADSLAQERTTSVYLINRVLPMLPHALCNHLCSLNPNEPKLAFSVHFRLDKRTGDLIEDGARRPRFFKSAISSCCRMNYDEVQEVLDNNDIDEIPPVYGDWTWPDVKKDLFILYDVCGKVRTNRMEGGALSISRQKMIFHTRESEDGAPTGYHLESHSASHWIIEELMLLANRCVAKFLANDPRLHQVGVLRKHESPDSKKSIELEKLLKENLGMDWESGSAGALYRSCRKMKQKYGDMLGLCVDMLVMRAGMKQAEYFVYDDVADPHHFALNFDYYTHFTSPIRRYPDVMVHRVLAAILTGEEDGFQDREEAEGQVLICNDKKIATRRCSEQIDRAVFCIFLRRMKEWFYTIGTVLAFHKDTNEGGSDTVTVYCSQLGKESKARLCAHGDLAGMELITNGIDDELLMPLSWEFKSRGALELKWPDSNVPDRVGKKQVLRTLSCVPVVIIPTNQVPVDYAMFFVSPFHKKAEALKKRVPQEAQDGFEWIEPPEEGVTVVHDARALGEGDQ